MAESHEPTRTAANAGVLHPDGPPSVGIVMGSRSDWATLQRAAEMLGQFGIPHECDIVSAHRTPAKLASYAQAAAHRGLKVIIAGAGGAAHLPGMLAAQTHLPVLGVPVESSMLRGVDSLLSIVQMPAGIPVGTLAIGPAGAVIYRLAEYLARAWTEPEHLRKESFGTFAKAAFDWIDWLPARLTAVAFAIVGNFEDSIYAWRNFARRWASHTTGIILSAGGGAMGVRLGTPAEYAPAVPEVDITRYDSSSPELEILPGEEPSARSLQSTVGLIWRALLLWILLLVLVSVANWLG
jgi:adenosylcobinamide-phosphate synthase